MVKRLFMKTLYFDVFSGASGDMILSSLIDLDVPINYIRAELSGLAIPGFSMDVEKVKRSGIMCSHLKLDWADRHSHMHGHDHTHHDHAHNDQDGFRNPRQILEIITKAKFKEPIIARCEKILMRLAQAEAAVHGVPVDEVHFHEIGAIDTIIDIAGISICIDYLGVERILFSTLTDGRGTVNTRHGIMPVPVPAVVKLCEGFALSRLDIESELLTPTGCASLVALGEQSETGFRGTIQKTGYGCGDKIFENSPNALRVFLIETSLDVHAGDDAIWCLESDMDHISGEIMADVAGRLMQQGSLDVSWCPVFMKKGRPGYRLSVICAQEKKQELIDLIMIHTRTLGVRMQRMERVVAHREVSTSELLKSEIQEKKCSYANTSFSKPEYESLAKLSKETGKPVIELIEEYCKKGNNKNLNG
jgi:pyridinium-3,5-bisthiocarboxylic acid mononucleotide nickel chelatase